MNTAHPRPRTGSALLTDLYQLTMAYGYWKTGQPEREAVFHLFFRKHPFRGGFSVACGLRDAIDYLRELTFPDEELHYLATLTGNDGLPLFEPGFLDYLRTLRWSCDMEGVPERDGRVSARADVEDSRSAIAVPDRGDGVAQHAQFPNAHRDESGPGVHGGEE
jgi:nicotinic acid phosphoribosyltransferase